MEQIRVDAVRGTRGGKLLEPDLAELASHRHGHPEDADIGRQVFHRCDVWREEQRITDIARQTAQGMKQTAGVLPAACIGAIPEPAAECDVHDLPGAPPDLIGPAGGSYSGSM